MDIVERLRNDDPVSGVRPSLAMEAADEIERLREDRDKYQKAFETALKALGENSDHPA
jgi:hypothetical protein